MFTGIIEEIGTVLTPSAPLQIKVHKITEDIHLGDSIAVNGVCLTVASFTNDTITLDVMNETYRRTNLHSLKTKDKVNIERAMPSQGRFGGHIVNGHIDGTGILSDISDDGIAKWLKISADSNILKYIIMKGSVALDGVSLTVADLNSNFFKVSVIPHTQLQTTLLTKPLGSKINIETDIIAKYIEKFTTPQNKSKITLDFLSQNGF